MTGFSVSIVFGTPMSPSKGISSEILSDNLTSCLFDTFFKLVLEQLMTKGAESGVELIVNEIIN